MTSFSKNHESPFDEKTSVTFHRLLFGDSIVVNVAVNGIIDSTFQVKPRPLRNSSNVFGENFNANDDIENDDQVHIVSHLEPVLLVGNHGNLKIQVVASEIAKLFCTIPACLEKDKVIFSIGLAWFGKDPDSRDFERVMFVLENLKKLFQ